MRMAFDYALDQGYEGIVTVDGNDKDDTRLVHRFIEALENGYDHVQGSRYIAGGKGVNTPLLRHYRGNSFARAADQFRSRISLH